MKETTFVSACREYFGLKPGETLQEFLAEVKQLNEADRKELIGLFPSVSYTIKA